MFHSILQLRDNQEASPVTLLEDKETHVLSRQQHCPDNAIVSCALSVSNSLCTFEGAAFAVTILHVDILVAPMHARYSYRDHQPQQDLLNPTQARLRQDLELPRSLHQDSSQHDSLSSPPLHPRQMPNLRHRTLHHLHQPPQQTPTHHILHPTSFHSTS